jgi:hypothetical protein
VLSTYLVGQAPSRRCFGGRLCSSFRQLALGSSLFESENVVVAMANYQRSRVPAFAAELDPRIVQLHSLD